MFTHEEEKVERKRKKTEKTYEIHPLRAKDLYEGKKTFKFDIYPK